MEKENQNVLLSVRPQYANLLVDGIKTVELRRKFPESLPQGTKCLIYSTAPEKMVIGECKIEKIQKLNIKNLWLEASSKAMVPWKDFASYFDGTEHGFAVHVYGYIRYDLPKKLESITGAASRPPQSYRYVPCGVTPVEV